MRRKSGGTFFLLLSIFVLAWMGTAWTWMVMAGNLHHAGFPFPPISFVEAFWMVSPLLAGGVLATILKAGLSDL